MRSAPPAAFRARLEDAVGRRATHWKVPDTGLSPAERYSVTLEDGTRIFVKAATDDDTERWLRNEYLALQHVPQRFTPGIVAWLDDAGLRPILVSEDLSAAHWPASDEGVDWRNGDIDRVLAAAADLAAVPAPTALEPLPESAPLWPALIHDPAGRNAFLDLGLCSAAWLSGAGDALARAEASLRDEGDTLVHGDLRSDNICIDGERVVFVDWSSASRGHPRHDLAALLPTLHLEGGPLPYDIMPSGGTWAAAGCATLVRRVLDQTAVPAWLSTVMIRLAAIDLSWAASCLGIAQPDGLDWRAI